MGDEKHIPCGEEIGCDCNGEFCAECEEYWPCTTEIARLRAVEAAARRALETLHTQPHGSVWCCTISQPHEHKLGNTPKPRGFPCKCQCGLQDIIETLATALGETNA